MSSTDLTPVQRLYEKSLAEHGTASLAVGWRDAASHELRFRKLAHVLADAKGPLSINDLGCGFGSFDGFLRGYGVDVALFRGYDISPEMVKLAGERVPTGEFHVGAVLDKPADFSFACGIFNVRLDMSEADWQRHVERTLDNLAANTRQGFAFNLLSTYVDYREPHLYYGDPLQYFDLCKRKFGRRVALLHDYPLYEWTMTVNVA